MKRTSVIQIRITPEEKAAWEKYAEKRNLSIAECVRSAMENEQERNQKRRIRIRMTKKRASEFGFVTARSLAIVPVDIDLSLLSPGARWIAEHITATYVDDEYFDKIDISAFASFSMAERDRKAGKSEDYITKMSLAYGDRYAKDPMRIINISFPIFGSAMSGTRTPEDVIEIAYQELVDGGTVRFKARNGDEFCVDK